MAETNYPYDPSTGTAVALPLSVTVSITGTVVLTDTTPVPTVTVILFKSDLESVVITTSTDSLGGFALGSVGSGSYILFVSIPRTPTTTYGAYADFAMPVNYTGTPLSVGTIVMPLLAVKGRVVLPGTSTPVTRTNVSLFNADRTINRLSRTDNGGVFRLGDLPAGSYQVVAYAPNRPGFGIYADSDPVPISYTSGVLNMGDVPLGQAAIYGRLVLPGTTTPVTGTGVSLYNENHSFQQNTSTGSDGIFGFGGVPTGNYFIKAYVPSRPGFDSYADSVPIPVSYTSGGPALNVGDVALSIVAIYGRVVLPGTTTPVTGTGVSLYNENHSFDRYDSVDGNGIFGFGGVPTGNYFIKADVPERPGFDSYADSVPIPVSYTSGGPALNVGDVSLSPVAIYGRVVLTGTTVPVTSTHVALYSPDYTFSDHTQTNSSGQFKFGPKPTGDYFIKADVPERPGFDSYADSAPNPISYTSGGPALNLGDVPLPLVAIYGRVVLPAGATGAADAVTIVSDTHVSLYEESGSMDAIRRDAQTDDNGRFKFGSVPTRNYLIRADVPRRSGFEAYANSESVLISYTAGGPALNAGDIPLSFILISGIVYDPGLSPVPWAWVNLHNFDWSQKWGASTDESGRYRLGGIPGGSYEAEAYAPSASPYAQSASVPVTVTPGVTQTLNLYLTRANITGTVNHPDGTPAPHTGIGVSSGGRRFPGTGTDDGGRFKVGGLISGTYQLEAFPSSEDSGLYGSSGAVTLNVISNVTVNTVLTLTVPVLRGRALMPDGSPATRAGVSVHNSDYSREAHSGTGLDGRFAISNLSSGIYSLELYVPWGMSGIVPPPARSVAVTAGLTNDVGSIYFLRATKHLVGLVRSNDGSQVIGAEAHANRNDGSGFASAFVSSSGPYSFTMDLSPGTWMVNLGPDPREGAPQPNWARSGPPESVSFDLGATSEETKTITMTVVHATASVYGRLVVPGATASFRGATSFEPHSVSVSFHNTEGLGNWGEVNTDGTFSVPLPGGTYAMEVHAYRGDWPYAAPGDLRVTVADGESRNIGDVRLLERNARIVGQVKDDADQGVADMQVSAWLQGGGGWVHTQTITNGVFVLPVISGTWQVEPQPSPDSSYTRTGPPTTVTVPNGGVQTVTLRVIATDARILGRVVDDVSGNVLSDLYGYAFVQREHEPGPGAPIERGLFTINVPAGSYRVSAGFPPGVGYTVMGSVPVTVTSGGSVSVELRARANDAAITGTIYNINDAPQTGVPVEIHAMSLQGGQQHTRSDPATAAYRLNVISGTWNMGTWVEPGTGYVVRQRSDNRVTVYSGQTQRWDVTVVRAGAVVSGTVYDAGGSPLAGAWVGAHEVVNVGAGRSIHVGDRTDVLGRYSFRVPGGTYWIDSRVSQERGLVSPHPVSTTLGVTGTANIDFRFRAADGVISGVVTLDGVPHRAFVWAWSESGGNNWMPTESGTFTLGVTRGDVWHLGANSEEGTTFYRSEDLRVVVGDSGLATQNITLTVAGTLPPPESFTFDASQMRIINLSDGTQIQIPAGAMVPTGTVTLRAVPKANLPRERDMRPLGLGYRLSAAKDTGETINSFNSAVTIVFSYTEEQLARLGVTETALVPSYWDDATSSWRPVDNVVVDTVNHRVSFQIFHFTDYGLLARTAAAAPSGGGNSISGYVSYTGGVVGSHTIYLGATTNPSQPPEYMTSILGPGAYTITGVANGTYYIVAFLDSNDSGGASPDPGEPVAAYGYGKPVTVAGSSPTGIDISLDDVPKGPLSGQVDLQGRANDAGASISLGVYSTTSLSNGGYFLFVPTGTYTVTIAMPGYLSAQRAAAVGTGLPGLRLLGGDGDRDNDVDIFDLVLAGANYSLPVPPGDSRADINGDGVVNIYDLVLVGTNFGRSGPVTW
ncbi:MAG: carboxypeptidase regulatory-like domain-containing protein [Chloroflexi bacterium]|nr:carboxypeptidase regulatory-like domain-containing protein [Chloroflexota bacterium]